MVLNTKRFESMKYGKELLSFYRVMMNRFPIIDKDDLISKLNDIDITSNPSNFKEILIKNFKNNPCGYYPEHNKILLINEKNINDYHIYHELFHMLSTTISKDIVYCGFSQNNRKTLLSIGNGLNEGYTQYLKEHYFGVDDNEKYYYMLEKHIAKHLEIIIGRRTMEKIYMSGSLYDLMLQLEKYSNEQYILNFINNVDYINKNIGKSELNNNVNLKLKESLMFLLDTYIAKQSLLYNKGLLNDKSYKNNVEKYLELLSMPLHYKGMDYQALNYNDVEFILYSNNLIPESGRYH